MVDISKVADLILLMIDASFGFEMVVTAPYMITPTGNIRIFEHPTSAWISKSDGRADTLGPV
jgi:hypothetical protein